MSSACASVIAVDAISIYFQSASTLARLRGRNGVARRPWAQATVCLFFFFGGRNLVGRQSAPTIYQPLKYCGTDTEKEKLAATSAVAAGLWLGRGWVWSHGERFVMSCRVVASDRWPAVLKIWRPPPHVMDTLLRGLGLVIGNQPTMRRNSLRFISNPVSSF